MILKANKICVHAYAKHMNSKIHCNKKKRSTPWLPVCLEQPVVRRKWRCMCLLSLSCTQGCRRSPEMSKGNQFITIKQWNQKFSLQIIDNRDAKNIITLQNKISHSLGNERVAELWNECESNLVGSSWFASWGLVIYVNLFHIKGIIDVILHTRKETPWEGGTQNIKCHLFIVCSSQTKG